MGKKEYPKPDNDNERLQDRRTQDMLREDMVLQSGALSRLVKDVDAGMPARQIVENAKHDAAQFGKTVGRRERQAGAQ